MIDLKKAQRTLWLFGLFKIPMIGFVGPKIIEFNEHRIIVKVPYKRRTLNHLKSVYLGALVVGADLVAGFHAFYMARERDLNISLVFKNFNAEFIKRPMSEVFFVCEEGQNVNAMIERSIESGERQTQDIYIKAYTNYPEDPEHIANFTLGLSLKIK